MKDRRIAVVGSPGAGKTTFVKKLSKKTGLPAVHLDYYYHQTKYNYYSDKDKWGELVKKLIKKERWIIDGTYKSTMDIRFERADTVIFLDYPLYILLYGILKRRFQGNSQKRSDMPPEWKEHISFYFLRMVLGFRGRPRAELLDKLSKMQNKNVYIFTNRKQTAKYLDLA